ncbi:hypothetical protein GCM10010275_25730 [Streptomyces litmocidini]|uniref:hypothetical protein n=1 Tax=Streptomyces litmocidini TaxID=67318 RepID=UPI00167D85F7|nr:hypothetical protein [Streptomyces litmocidini]GGU88525.1 hypothetical protein GCM10010275_25730 [Streptomyces litmocidini]
MGEGGEKDGPSVPDEMWEEFLRTSADGAGNAPKELSAADREAAGRPRAERAEPTPWRAHTPARPERPGRGSRRRNGWYAAGFLASLVLFVVALDPGGVVGRTGGGEPTGKPLAQETGRPEQAPPPEPGGRPTLDEPFRGSPAARWANGTAGITVPAARATGWMTKAEVERALTRSRDFLAASGLDPAVLRGGRPEKAIALMNPHQKDVTTYVTASLRAPDEEHDPLLLFSRFDPARARPAGDVVKTRGRISYREGRRGALEVTADVTYVYPVAPAGGGDEVVRVIVRRETVMSWDDPSKVITEEGTFSLLSYKTDMTNGGCGNATGYFRPEFGGGGAGGGAGGESVDPYDRTGPITEGRGSCGTATRS